jgi:hypothetical protein
MAACVRVRGADVAPLTGLNFMPNFICLCWTPLYSYTDDEHGPSWHGDFR